MCTGSGGEQNGSRNSSGTNRPVLGAAAARSEVGAERAIDSLGESCGTGVFDRRCQLGRRSGHEGLRRIRAASDGTCRLPANRLARRDERLDRRLDRQEPRRGRPALSRQDLGGGPDKPRPARCASRRRRGGRQASRLSAQGVEGPSERGVLHPAVPERAVAEQLPGPEPGRPPPISSKPRAKASWTGSRTCWTIWSMAKAASRSPPTTRRRSLSAATWRRRRERSSTRTT